MDRYCVNKDAQTNGDHEVHKYSCQKLPSPSNRVDLGIFSNDYAALAAARRLYPSADGCWYCCPDINHS